MSWNPCRHVVLFLLFFCLASTAGANSPMKERDMVGTVSPGFDLVDLDQNRLSLSAFSSEGKVVVLNFWGIRCGACIEEMPYLNEISKKYRGQVVVIGLNVDAIDATLLRKQVRKIGIKVDYPIVPDPEFKMVDLFKMTAAPLTIVIDASGIIRYQHENYEPGDEKALEEEILRILHGAKISSRTKK